MHDILTVFSREVVPFAATLIVHSSIILIIGLIGLHVSRRYMAYASFILHVSVFAVLLTPVSAYLFSQYGVFRMQIPGIEKKSTYVAEPRVATKTTPVAQEPPDPAEQSDGAGNSKQEQYKPLLEPERPAQKEVVVRKYTISSDDEVIVSPEKTAIQQARPRIEKIALPEKDTRNAIPESVVSEKLKQPSARDKGIPLASFYSLFALFWVAASVFLTVKILYAMLEIAKMKKEAVVAKPEYLDACRYYADILGVDPPPVLCNPEVTSAFLTGVFRPTIFLPSEREDETVSSREILVHELAHLTRKDTLWNLVVQAGKVVIPFQPLMWVIDRQMKITSDFICDDIVMHITKSRRDYAEQLYRIAEEGCLMAVQSAASVGFFSIDSSFLTRIERILDRHRPLSYSLHKRQMIVTVVFGSIGFVSVSFMGITADSTASIPKKVVSLETSMKVNGRNLMVPVDHRKPAGALSDENVSLAGILAGINEKEDDSEHESPVITGSKVKNIQHIMESVDMDSSPVEFRFAATGGTDSRAMVEFGSSILQEGEREYIGSHLLIPTGAMVGEKAGYERESNMLESIIDHNLEIDQSLAWQDAASGIASYNMQDTGTGKASGTLKSLDVTIPSDYEYSDLSNPNYSKMREFYQSLRKSKLNPVWSPDGSKIAFNDKEYGIWVVNADGGEPVLIYDNYYKLVFEEESLHWGDLCTLGFSPDGRYVAFRHYEIDLEHGTKVIIDERDNARLFNIQNPLPVIEIIDLVTGVREVLAENATTGAYSPDGKLFAYITEVPDSPSELWVMNMDNGLRELLPFENPTELHFGTDGNSLIVEGGDSDENRRIVRVGLDGDGTEEMLVTGAVSLADVSPDGRWLLYSVESSAIQRSDEESAAGFMQTLYDLREGTIYNMAEESRESSWGRFSPDGSQVCLNLKSGGSWEIYMQDFTPPLEIEKDMTLDAPTAFSLKGNFPNPFNMTTTIEYTVAQDADFSLVIYNSLGQKVRDLVSEHLSAGAHRTIWDGLDNDGNTVSNGTYIAEMKTAGCRSTLKMSLMK